MHFSPKAVVCEDDTTFGHHKTRFGWSHGVSFGKKWKCAKILSCLRMISKPNVDQGFNRWISLWRHGENDKKVEKLQHPSLSQVSLFHPYVSVGGFYTWISRREKIKKNMLLIYSGQIIIFHHTQFPHRQYNISPTWISVKVSGSHFPSKPLCIYCNWF